MWSSRLKNEGADARPPTAFTRGIVPIRRSPKMFTLGLPVRGCHRLFRSALIPSLWSQTTGNSQHERVIDFPSALHSDISISMTTI